MQKIKLLSWVLLIIVCVSSCRFSKIRKSTDLKVKYDAAMRYYDKRDYYKSGLLLEEIIPLITGQKEQEVAQFRYAYCHFNQKQYDLSSYYFDKFYNSFRGSKWAEEARFMVVKSLVESSPNHNLDQKSTADAINSAQSFLNNFGNSTYYEQTSAMMKEMRQKLEKKGFENAKLYHRIGYHRAAVVAFSNFQKSFPDSDYNEDVAYLRIESQYDYALQSIETKKIDRLKDVIEFYEVFVTTYPKSKYTKSAQNMHKKAINTLQENKKNIVGLPNSSEKATIKN
ncbi:MAG: outer membrane protein assembly factor BamD [Bacteroidetes bacterium]|nr:MAG: outer membrane protein assembly factor BamD [Bacteroidota bacterium]TAG86905.1 MAG: outer membrane protein assembly factor BamD [Bacteroidota bacterium]